MLTEPAKQRCFFHFRFWRLLTYPLDKETENLIIYLEDCLEEHGVGISVNQRPKEGTFALLRCTFLWRTVANTKARLKKTCA